MSDLSRLAHGVLFPGVGRPRLPRWAAKRIDRGVGGFVVYGKDVESAEQVRALTDAVHGLREHVLVATDEEGGDVSRLEYAGGISTPGNLPLGRIDEPDTTEAAAYQVGLSLRDAGIDWDLAPTVDVAANPLTPIGSRSFGADRGLVSRHTAAWVRGLQAAGPAACAKHFPGHGESNADAHFGATTVGVPRDELLASYLDPFRAAIAAGVDSIMVSHDRLTAVDPDLPSTISAPVITGILRTDLGYDGVVLTDALEMRGIADVADVPTAAVRAIAAGADALCLGSWAYGEDVDAAAAALVAAVRDGRLDEGRLRQANDRLARLGTRARSAADRDDEIGVRLARRALVVHGDPRVRGRHVLTVRLTPSVSPAIGRRDWGIEPLLADAGLELTTVVVDGDTYNGPGMVRAEIGQYRSECGADAPVVIQVRSPHRFDWTGPILADLRDRCPDAVVVDMGVPGESFAGFRGWVRTFGASRACAQAAVGALLG
ncbi:glycoside hydrolase family 3 N-terminal domain-containing protein [Actinocatenispora rupis]|uniref:Sugar hydrolase n=1 Tax=Actinocatenispora rupis TaxID=519421 RepID=A0A8J3JD41_9ACTN|nr:glycoside hydrolase family 3 N-terminal domain-containing protein [Actinocatenispora rupis]GID16210.1 sugar hydrolase [Actinocatenispora rupis]